jgi:hypothetical protein
MIGSPTVLRAPIARALLLVQCGLAAAWVPHGWELDRDSTTMHIEAAAPGDCPSVHDEGACPLYQLVTSRSLPAPFAVIGSTAHLARTDAPTQRPAPHTPTTTAPPRLRGPPLAVS